jgi:hypothetical protein
LIRRNSETDTWPNNDFRIKNTGVVMLFQRLLSCIACAVIVTGCATEPPKPPPPTVAYLMAGAEAAIKAGRNEDAAAWLKAGFVAYPADKAPRLRMAQLQFDCHNYGEAITHAQAVLERDPDDMVAHSIAAVSGLRVSSKALTDLANKNDLTGSVRAEAQDLAKLLRANIGGEIIPKPVAPLPMAPKPAATKPAPANELAEWLRK